MSPETRPKSFGTFEKRATGHQPFNLHEHTIGKNKVQLKINSTKGSIRQMVEKFVRTSWLDCSVCEQCSPQVLAQQVRDNSWPVFLKTTYKVLVNLQKVAGGKKFLELLFEAVNFTGYGLIRRTLASGMH